MFVMVFAGCTKTSYSFKYPIDKIDRIEIVSAESSLEFSVIKKLSETEKNDFLEQFQSIEFREYILGDPMSIGGKAIKITYSNDEYELICHYWSVYVKNGETYSIRRNCNEDTFEKIVDLFLG